MAAKSAMYAATMDADRPVVCIFRSTRTDHSSVDYHEWSERMDRLVATIPGYISHTTVVDTSTRSAITVSYFQSLEDLNAWREVPGHREAQALGQSRFYVDYDIDVAQVIRRHEWTAPTP